MEVVPTNDGDEDDGVIWFRCPQCQGFLPKLSGADLTDGEAEESDTAETASKVDVDAGASATETTADNSGVDDSMPWDSPADMMAAEKAGRAGNEGQAESSPGPSPFLPEDDTAEVTEAEPDTESGTDKTVGYSKGKSDEKKEPAEPPEPIHEYAAMLAELDVGESTPYRPWGTYETGQCIHHLAWEDCGVVVAKEDLPGGRKIIKCYFEDAGVVRLIEQAPR